ncbi:MAG TPA: hypothetical protein VE568_03990, partial [Rubrobacter sp.]|nr:hypothetical protein [Rubrobacter sp.]
NPTPLEVLLTERVVASWLLLEILEAFVSLQLSRGVQKYVSPTYLHQMAKLLESVQRRYLPPYKHSPGCASSRATHRAYRSTPR